MTTKTKAEVVVDVTLGAETFSGELLDAFANDPLGIGHQASGKVAEAAQALRDAYIATLSATGQVLPAAYHLTVTGDYGVTLTPA